MPTVTPISSAMSARVHSTWPEIRQGQGTVSEFRSPIGLSSVFLRCNFDPNSNSFVVTQGFLEFDLGATRDNVTSATLTIKGLSNLSPTPVPLSIFYFPWNGSLFVTTTSLPTARVDITVNPNHNGDIVVPISTAVLDRWTSGRFKLAVVGTKFITGEVPTEDDPPLYWKITDGHPHSHLVFETGDGPTPPPPQPPGQEWPIVPPEQRLFTNAGCAEVQDWVVGEGSGIAPTELYLDLLNPIVADPIEGWEGSGSEYGVGIRYPDYSDAGSIVPNDQVGYWATADMNGATLYNWYTINKQDLHFYTTVPVEVSGNVAYIFSAQVIATELHDLHAYIRWYDVDMNFISETVSGNFPTLGFVSQLIYRSAISPLDAAYATCGLYIASALEDVTMTLYQAQFEENALGVPSAWELPSDHGSVNLFTNTIAALESQLHASPPGWKGYSRYSFGALPVDHNGYYYNDTQISFGIATHDLGTLTHFRLSHNGSAGLGAQAMVVYPLNQSVTVFAGRELIIPPGFLRLKVVSSDVELAAKINRLIFIRDATLDEVFPGAFDTPRVITGRFFNNDQLQLGEAVLQFYRLWIRPPAPPLAPLYTYPQRFVTTMPWIWDDMEPAYDLLGDVFSNVGPQTVNKLKLYERGTAIATIPLTYTSPTEETRYLSGLTSYNSVFGQRFRTLWYGVLGTSAGVVIDG